MRRFLPYVLLLVVAVLTGGCAATDYVGGPYGRMPALSEMNLSHQAIECGSLDKIPGANTQQIWEKNLLNFQRVAYPGTTWCNVTPIGKVSAEEAKEWARFVGPWMTYNELNVTGSGCQVGQYVAAGVKGLDDGSVRISNFKYGPPTPLKWSCAFSYGGPYTSTENIILGEEASNYFPLSPWNTQAPTGLWLVAVDKVPVNGNWGFQQNLAAFNFDNTVLAENCDSCITVFAGFGGRYYEGNLNNAAMKGSAGLAEFFNGEPLTFEHRGVKYTVSGEQRQDGMVNVSLHGLETESSVYTAVKPVVMAMDWKTGHRRMSFDFDSQRDELVRLGQWALDNFDFNTPMQLGGFVPELGIKMPNVSLLWSEPAVRHYVTEQTSGIEPRRREGTR